ncbi:hypothetical protein [Nocardia mexicana]|uniref:Uncharacterized protein n=1 Tax=Nocardia mexicana TaxID=279262 RepID=A0A370H4L3_9NOCA|nr:hypothetical protein [Nocardia mexicana]RDI51116.1 hypothetical protein DFR68_105593 [Nocardia mexicana]
MLIATIVVAVTAMLRRRFGKGRGASRNENRHTGLRVSAWAAVIRGAADSARRAMVARIGSGRSVLVPGIIAGVAAVTLLSAAVVMVPCWCGGAGSA